jgi:hypothetical protein
MSVHKELNFVNSQFKGTLIFWHSVLTDGIHRYIPPWYIVKRNPFEGVVASNDENFISQPNAATVSLSFMSTQLGKNLQFSPAFFLRFSAFFYVFLVFNLFLLISLPSFYFFFIFSKSLSLSFLYIYLSHFQFQSLFVSLCLSLTLPNSFSLSLSLYVSLSISFYLSVLSNLFSSTSPSLYFFFLSTLPFPTSLSVTFVCMYVSVISLFFLCYLICLPLPLPMYFFFLSKLPFSTSLSVTIVCMYVSLCISFFYLSISLTFAWFEGNPKPRMSRISRRRHKEINLMRWKPALPARRSNLCFDFESGLPDGLIWDQKSKFGYFSEGLAM